MIAPDDPLDDFARYNSWRVQLGLRPVSRPEYDRARASYLRARAAGPDDWPEDDLGRQADTLDDGTPPGDTGR